MFPDLGYELMTTPSCKSCFSRPSRKLSSGSSSTMWLVLRRLALNLLKSRPLTCARGLSISSALLYFAPWIPTFLVYSALFWKIEGSGFLPFLASSLDYYFFARMSGKLVMSNSGVGVCASVMSVDFFN